MAVVGSPPMWLPGVWAPGVWATSGRVVTLPRVNVALAATGAVAVASSTHSPAYAAAGANNGDRQGTSWGRGGGWNDGTADAFPDWFEVAFAGLKTIDEVAVFSVQDSYQTPSEPTVEMTCSLYGLTDFDVQYLDGTQWRTVPGGTVRGNTLVWRRVTFPALTTAGIRIWVTQTQDGWSRIAQVEAYEAAGAAPSSPLVEYEVRVLNGQTVVQTVEGLVEADGTDLLTITLRVRPLTGPS